MKRCTVLFIGIFLVISALASNAAPTPCPNCGPFPNPTVIVELTPPATLAP